MNDTEQILELTGKKPHMLVYYISPMWKNIVYNEAKSMFNKDAFDMGKFMKHINGIKELKPHMKKVAQEARFLLENPTAFRISMLEPDEQISSIKDYIEIIRSKFGQVDVSVYNSETPGIYDPARKTGKSRPMKPAIYIE